MKKEIVCPNCKNIYFTVKIDTVKKYIYITCEDKKCNKTVTFSMTLEA